VSLEQDHAAEVAAAVERRVRTAEEGRPRMAAWCVCVWAAGRGEHFVRCIIVQNCAKLMVLILVFF